MVQSGAPSTRSSRSFYVPSVRGGFVGKIFYSSSISNRDPIEDSGFIILPLQDAKVIVWDVNMKRVIHRFEVKREERVVFKPKAEEIMVKSDRPITLAFIHNGSYRGDRPKYGAGVTFMGVKPDEETIFFLPMNSTVQAYIFSSEDAQVEVNGVPITIRADSFFLITSPGVHRVKSNKNLVIEVLHWPRFPLNQGIVSFCTVVPCIQTVSKSVNVRLTPLLKEGFPVFYLMIAIGAIIACLITAFLMKRRIR